MEQKLVSGVSVAELCGIISICVFVVFFTVTLLWALKLKSNYLKHMEELPLDGGEKNATDNHQPEKR
jgi:hypothetical protein